jgi:hypothetical protein
MDRRRTVDGPWNICMVRAAVFNVRPFASGKEHDMDSLVAHVLAWVATTALGALAGFLVSLLRRQFGREKALAKGMSVLLRGRLVDIHRRYVVEGKPCTVDVKEEADEVYAAYHGLGGNGTGTHLHDEIMEAHISRKRQ